MKIRTQFTITMYIFGLLLISMAVSLVFISRQSVRLRQQEQVAQQIEQVARELSYLTNDYLLHNESQQQARWEAKFQSLSDLLTELEPGTPEQQVLVAQIWDNQERLKSIFADVANTLDGISRTPGTEPTLTFIQLSWSRMEVQTQSTVFIASRLGLQLRDQSVRLNRIYFLLLFSLLSIFGAYIIINYQMIYRRTLQSLANLQTVTRLVGSGNLDYTIDEQRADEIGDLSRAFNAMTANLREITASKSDLEREIKERIVTEKALEQANRSLKKYTEELKRSNQALEDFAFIASHDLREPLRKVRAFSDRLRLLPSEDLDELAQDYIQRMHRAVERMETMLDGLLDYSRISTQTQTFSMVDLRQAALEVVSDLEIRIMQTRGRVIIDDLPLIEADPIQMRQLLQNLVGNGLKFRQPELPPVVRVYTQTPDGKEPGTVDLSAEGISTLAPCVEIVIEDNGIGFDPKHISRLFKPFHRLVDKNAYDGSGMGLAICRKIVERHGGSIAVQSTPGKGSTFIVTLPTQQSKT